MNSTFRLFLDANLVTLAASRTNLACLRRAAEGHARHKTGSGVASLNASHDIRVTPQ